MELLTLGAMITDGITDPLRRSICWFGRPCRAPSDEAGFWIAGGQAEHPRISACGYVQAQVVLSSVYCVVSSVVGKANFPSL